jgi:hypothetical protein
VNTIWDVYLFIKSLVLDKYLQSVPSPEAIGYALGVGQQNLFDYYKKLKEEGDDEAATALAQFVLTTSTSANSSGIIAYPTDWFDTELIFETVSGEVVTYNPILDNEIYEAKKSVLYPIASSPRYQEVAAGIQCYPQTTHASLTLKYMIKPTYPVIGYTVTGNTIAYNSGTSTQLGFNKAYWNKIILLSMPYIGVNLQDADVASLGGLFNKPTPNK